MRKHPHLIEINAFLFLRRMSEKYGKPLTLDSIPQAEWQALAAQGFDLIWMMGVWKRSPQARQRALSEPQLTAAYRDTLKDFKETDVAGSPYAVYGYQIDPSLGNASALSNLKENLRQAGIGLILDYVPNHCALDHPWTLERPECFVEVSQEVFSKHPGLFFKTSKQRFLAHGRDPYFSPWTDTAQIHYFSPAARNAAAETLLKIAETSSGVRCDMAMLGIARIFEKTWGPFLENTPKPAAEFWKDVIDKVRTRYPDFIFIAETYWDLEWEIQQLGFDFTYDKKLYDRLRHTSAPEVKGHLKAELSYQNRSVRFIENHDESRAASVFGFEKSLAAAAIMATVPGMRFFQDGQAQGKVIRVPVQLNREPQEKENPGAIRFYEKLLPYASHLSLHEGQWQMHEVLSSGGTHANHGALLSWDWRQGKMLWLIVVNYSPLPAQGRVFFQSEGLLAGVVKLKDAVTGAVYDRNAGEIKDQGLYVDLAPWQTHLFEIKI